jgi:SNF2 family DNA or RNA helicase
VDPAKRQDMVDEFKKSEAGTVLTAQIQAGGTGLNIQAASVVIICEPQLKPSAETQAIGRAYRMGQSRSVLVYRLLGDETLDERMLEILRAKQEQFDAFADKSVAAENVEIDDATLSNLIEKEIVRIQEKNAATTPVAS